MKRTISLLMVCALLLSCAKEMTLPEQPVQEDGTYTLTVEASKGERPDTKALMFVLENLNAFWKRGEEVSVYKADDLLGTLTPQIDGEETTLQGKITGNVRKGDVRTLKFLNPDYANQDGTIQYIAAHCDYAVAHVTVTNVEGGTVTTEKATFQNQQAIVLFNLNVNAKPLTVNVANLAITVTPSDARANLYVAVPALSSEPISLRAMVGDKQHILLKNNVTLEAGKYYSINATLQEATVVHDESELHAVLEGDQANAYIVFANDIPIENLQEIHEDKTITIDMNGYTLNRGCASRGTQALVTRLGGTLNLCNGTVTGGYGGNGGALDVQAASTANLFNVIISGNAADDRGGGISNIGTLTMTGGAILNNTSKDQTAPSGGGGLYNAAGSTATLRDVTITGNMATVTGGGGICNYGTLILDGCTIEDNVAQTEGGGVWNGPDALLKMQGENFITGNTSEGGVTNNIHLKTGSVITVTGSLAGSSIGINMQTEGAFTSGFSTYHSGVKPASIFTPDRIGAKAVFLDNDGKEAQLATIPTNCVYYVERSWNASKGEVVATIQYLTEQIAFDATPTSETQYKLLPSTSDKTMNLGTENSTLHEFYVVTGTVKVNELLLVGPNVHIILCDDAQLVLGNSSKTSESHDIVVTENHTIYIHDQGSKDHMGKLYNDSGSEYYGCIGGEVVGTDYGGNIEIHGGDINLTAPGYNAAIGGCYDRLTGDITIYGGNIHAEGGRGASGIGAGNEVDDYGHINIYGGVIYAKGGDEYGVIYVGGGAGIGGGFTCKRGEVHIYGGDITAYGNEDDSAGIGSSQYADSAGYITIDGGLVKAYGGDEAAGIGGGDGIPGAYVTINGGEVRAYGGIYAAGIGGGEGASGGVVAINGGLVLAVAGENGAGIGAGDGGDNHGTLDIVDSMMVQYKDGDNYKIAPSDNRIHRSREADVRVEICTHPGYTDKVEECPYHKH
jgi:hypothetical protein